MDTTIILHACAQVIKYLGHLRTVGGGVCNLKFCNCNGTCKVCTKSVYKAQITQGTTFNVAGRQEQFYGTIALASADNLASQQLGGYKQLASAYRRCRYCMATRDNMDKQVRFLHANKQPTLVIFCAI